VTTEMRGKEGEVEGFCPISPNPISPNHTISYITLTITLHLVGTSINKHVGEMGLVEMGRQQWKTMMEGIV